MKHSAFICILLMGTLGFQCTNDETTNDQFVFGVAYGFCSGDCAHFFRIKDQQLFTDSMERYVSDEYMFKSAALADEKYHLAKSLLDEFPEYLLDHANQTFGCPDCADQGGYHLLRVINGTTYFWHIDTNSMNQPVEIREYIERMRNVIEELRQ